MGCRVSAAAGQPPHIATVVIAPPPANQHRLSPPACLVSGWRLWEVQLKCIDVFPPWRISTCLQQEVTPEIYATLPGVGMNWLRVKDGLNLTLNPRGR